MSGPGFTPGPWAAAPYYSERSNSGPVPNRYTGIYAVYPGQKLGSRSSVLTVGIKGPVDDYWLYLSDTHAKLIAAAPDLYAASREALNYIENTEAELGIKLASGDALRAALAKAEGTA